MLQSQELTIDNQLCQNNEEALEKMVPSNPGQL